MMARLALYVLLATAAYAQWLNYPDSGVPRTPDGKVNLAAPAPHINGTPDLSGVWRVPATPPTELKRIFGGFLEANAPLTVPGMNIEVVNKYFINVLADFKPQEAPIKPATVTLMNKRRDIGGGKVCVPGPVAPYIPDPHKFIQSPREIVILYEADGSHRQIFTDGRPFPKEFIQPSFQGFSTAKWEGETLVVQTAGFNDETMLDLMGHPHGEGLRVTERYHRIDFGHMDVETTMEDPEFYSKPFTMKYSEILVPDTDVLESVCNENEKDVRHMQVNKPAQ